MPQKYSLLDINWVRIKLLFITFASLQKKIEIADIRAVELIETYYPYYNIHLSGGKTISTIPIGNRSDFTEAITFCRNQIDTNWHYTEKNTKILG